MFRQTSVILPQKTSCQCQSPNNKLLRPEEVLINNVLPSQVANNVVTTRPDTHYKRDNTLYRLADSEWSGGAIVLANF